MTESAMTNRINQDWKETGSIPSTPLSPGVYMEAIWTPWAITTVAISNQLAEAESLKMERSSERQLKHMAVFEQDHEQQQQVAGFRRIHVNDFDQVVKNTKGDQSHPCPGDANLFDHARIENPFIRSPRGAFENARFAALESERHILDAVRHQIQPEELGGEKGQRQTRCLGRARKGQFGHAGADQQPDHLPHIVVGDAPLFDTSDDGGEVVVAEDQLGGPPRHVGAAFAHGYADVGRIQRGCVVDPVPGHGDEFAPILEMLHQPGFLLRLDSCEDVAVIDLFDGLRIGVALRIPVFPRSSIISVPVTAVSSSPAILSCLPIAIAVFG